jgi:ribosomal protein S18 acetylase RimI-like enzyme
VAAPVFSGRDLRAVHPAVKARGDVLVSGSERIRTGLWRGDERTAYLAPVPDAPAPSAPFVQRCLRDLSTKGFSRVVTAALAPSERQPFIALGFEEQERLELLVHDLRDIPEASHAGIKLRRARAADRTAIVELDARSFSHFWHLDEIGLEQSVKATAWSRFRVAIDCAPRGSQAVVGYAITGRAGREGYLQRLAVDPGWRKRGIGRALAVDGLCWLRRWRVERAFVNTQQGNDVALSFYLRLGFRPQPADLVVLRRDLV